jgi:hypothetical protein
VTLKEGIKSAGFDHCCCCCGSCSSVEFFHISDL